MENRRKLLTILISLLVLIIISGSFALINHNRKEKTSYSTSLDNDETEITRGGWIEVLARSLGMDDFQNEEPYFEDINYENDIYKYVQSCYEWDVLKFEDKEIRPDDPATREFMIKTSILATGIDTGQQREHEEENILLYAVENGFIDSIEPKYLNETVTMGESVAVSEWTTDTYLNKEFVEYENVEINEKVINYTDLTSNEIIVINGNSLELSAQHANNMNIGDVFVSPATPENPFGVAYKVAAITYEGDRAIIQVTEPELGDIYNELEFAARAVPDTDYMILGEGVELVSNDISTYPVSHDKGLLPTTNNVYDRNMFRYSGDSNHLPQNISKKGMDLSFKVNFTKGKLSIAPTFDTAIGKVSADISQGKFNLKPVFDTPMGEVSADISSVGKDIIAQEDLGTFFEKTGYIIDKVPDGHEFQSNKEGFEKKLTAVNKFSGGYEVTGSLSIKNFYVDIECKTKKAFGVPYGIQYFITESNIDVESTLTVKGHLKEELKISTLPIPIVTGVTVDVDFILYADLNGELKVKAVISNNTITEYSNGNTKKTSKQTQNVDGSVGAKLEVGPSIKATLKALGIKLIDVQLKTGVLIEAEAKVVGEVIEETIDNKVVETQRICYKADVGMYVPTVSVSIGTGKTLANKVGIKFNWKIYAKSGGLLKSTHIPFYSNTWTIWEKVEAVDIKEYEKNSDALGSLSIMDYVIYMDMGTRITIDVNSLPPGYEREDLMAVSGDNSIVQVDGFGELSATSPGSTIITVSTNDGKYNVYCSVTVRGEME